LILKELACTIGAGKGHVTGWPGGVDFLLLDGEFGVAEVLPLTAHLVDGMTGLSASLSAAHAMVLNA